MAKIKILDLPEDIKISAADLSRIRGGTAFSQFSEPLFKSYSPSMIIGDFGLPTIAPISQYAYRLRENRDLRWHK